MHFYQNARGSGRACVSALHAVAMSTRMQSEGGTRGGKAHWARAVRAFRICCHAKCAPRAQNCASEVAESLPSPLLRCTAAFFTLLHHPQSSTLSSPRYVVPPSLVKHPTNHIAATQHALQSTSLIVVDSAAFVMLVPKRVSPSQQQCASDISSQRCLIDGHHQLTARVYSH